MGYTGASTVTPTTPTELRLKSGVLRLSIPLPCVRVTLTANRAVMRLFGAFFAVVVGISLTANYDTGIPGSACV